MDAREALAAAFLKLPPRWQRQALHALGRYAPWEPRFDRRAPDPPAGLVTAAPDFVGVGVQKAGTSWWFSLISAHPGAYHHAAYHKERHFFSALHSRTLDDGEIAAESAEYRRWFPRPEGRISGEWTPDYLHQHWTPPLLARAAPEARLLVLLRDPVERYRSGLDHHRRRGEQITPMIAADAFARGLYGLQLERLERVVPRRQVLVLVYESCVEDPKRSLAATYRFLGLDDGFVPASLERPVSETAAKGALSARARAELGEQYAADLAVLRARRPELDLGRWTASSLLGS